TDVMISTRSVGLLIDTVVCLSLAKWETVSGRFGGYFTSLNVQQGHGVMSGPDYLTTRQSFPSIKRWFCWAILRISPLMAILVPGCLAASIFGYTVRYLRGTNHK